MSASIFQRTNQRYINASNTIVREIPIPSPLVSSVLEACRNLFFKIDRGTPELGDLVRMLWRLRTHVLFTMLPFDSAEIALAGQLGSLRQELLRIPDLANETAYLEGAVQHLLSQPGNPKRQWLIDRFGGVAEGSAEGVKQFGFLAAMTRAETSTGYSLGVLGVDMPTNLTVVESRQQLLASVFDTLIIPGTCQYLSGRMFTEIFYMGRAKEIEVLLYPGERFILRERLVPLDSQLFRNRLSNRRIRVSMDEIPATSHEDLDADKELGESLWNMSHDGERSPRPGHVEARYILLGDGQGLFVPTGKETLLVWRDQLGDIEPVMASIAADEVAEGDWLVMRPNNTGQLLDLLSAEAGFEEKLTETCDWRPALERFLLTESPEKLAESMEAAGAHGVSLAQSIRNWADGSVYGPGHRNELRALLAVLVRHGMISPPLNFDAFVESHWMGLQELRGIRHRAGVNLRHALTVQIADALKTHASLSESQVLHLASGINVQLTRVMAMDDRSSWVPSLWIMQLRPMKGSKWQG